MAGTASTATPDRSGRQDRRRERTRAALLTAAGQLLCEGGDRQASIREITELADVGFGSFYNHFTTREELFEAATEAAFARYAAWIDDQLGDVDAVNRLHETIRLTGRLPAEQPETARILMRRLLDVDAATGTTARTEGIRRDIALALSMSSGRFDQGDVETLTAAVVGAVQSVLVLAARLPAAEAGRAADTLADGVLRLLAIDRP